MSDTATAETTDVDGHDDHADGEHAHASDLLYIKIAAGLAVLTAAEVAWPYITEHVIKEDSLLVNSPLLILMVIKFVIIGAFFMHLKFDSKILTRVFYTGLVLAVGVYLAAMWTFTHGPNVFHGG